MFLSDSAKQAKQHRQRCERHWKRTGCETDRVAYRSACRTANRLINESRSNYFVNRIDGLVGDASSTGVIVVWIYEFHGNWLTNEIVID